MISVIIPAYNEEENIVCCIEAVQHQGDDIEIIVADGGGTDRTVELAGRLKGVIVVREGKGRGGQMNAGASRANGEILLFLHADTTLEEGWSQALAGALRDSSVVGGAFTFAIDNPGKKYRAVEQWVKLRCSLLKLPYGDQGIFIRKEIFEKLGGYENIPLMEDVDFMERMKGLGKIVILEKKAATSGRRWLKKGFFHTAMLNQLIMLLYKMGVSPHKLARIYY
jgi:rSAM/selenodomain-associated transferase 2